MIEGLFVESRVELWELPLSEKALIVVKGSLQVFLGLSFPPITDLSLVLINHPEEDYQMLLKILGTYLLNSASASLIIALSLLQNLDVIPDRLQRLQLISVKFLKSDLDLDSH